MDTITVFLFLRIYENVCLSGTYLKITTVRQPQFFENGRQPHICLEMEDDLIYLVNGKKNML